MELSDDEILAAADRIREQRGLRVVRECANCGTSFAAEPGERFCSTRCENAESRTTAAQVGAVSAGDDAKADIESRSYREHFARVANRPLTEADEAFIGVMERIRAYWSTREPLTVDSVDVIRQGREERLEQLTGQ